MTSTDLHGRVAVITGGTSGIGLATAEAFVRSNARVALFARDDARGDAAQKQLNNLVPGAGLFWQVDVTQPEQVEAGLAAVVSKFGALDIIFSNAGSNEPTSAVDTSIESWHRVIDANLSSHFFLAKYGIPHMLERRAGSIILTSSEFGLVGGRNKVAYCAAKGGLHNMTRQLAVDYSPRGIRVNCLAPGAVRTPLLERHILDHEDPVAFERDQVRPILLGRLAEPDEIASAALFLASDMAAYLTGSTLLVDGGVTAWYGI